MAKRYKFALLAIAAFYGWFIYAATTATLPSSQKPIIFYSNQARCDFRQTLATAIKKASSIYFSIYSLTDKKIISLLHEKALLGAHVELEFDHRATPSVFLPPIQTHPIQSKGLMHRKIAVLDQQMVFLGSANFTTSSLTLHNNLSIGLYHPPLAHFLLEKKEALFSFEIGHQRASLYLLPEAAVEAFETLSSKLSQAKRLIYVAMFTLTHDILIDQLIAAKERGVHVEIALDVYSGRGASKKGAKRLTEAGIPIHLSYGGELLHHKWAWIDEQTLIVGSTNWTKAAFSKNHDLLFVLGQLTQEQNRYLKRIWSALASFHFSAP